MELILIIVTNVIHESAIEITEFETSLFIDDYDGKFSRRKIEQEIELSKSKFKLHFFVPEYIFRRFQDGLLI
jgi:hypothetical protein